MWNLPLWMLAGIWGGLTGSALILGSLIGYFARLNQRVVAGVMAFGSGALISALSFELTEEAFQIGSMMLTTFGFVMGAVVYSVINFLIAQSGGRHRKRSDINRKLREDQREDQRFTNALAIAVGAFLDGIPESLVIGLGMTAGGIPSIATVAAIFVSNIPEGLSSSAGMKNAGKPITYVLTIWGGIAFLSGITSCLGNLLFQDANSQTVSVIMAIAAGAILAMIVDTMIPEAYEVTHDFAGLITVAGFLSAFILHSL